MSSEHVLQLIEAHHLMVRPNLNRLARLRGQCWVAIQCRLDCDGLHERGCTAWGRTLEEAVQRCVRRIDLPG